MGSMETVTSEAKGFLCAIGGYGSPVERCEVYRVSGYPSVFAPSRERKRVAEVVILLRLRNGRYLVHTKRFYPEGIYRLLSGGIKADEGLVTAVRRETKEETGLDVRVERFLGILRHRFVWQGGSLSFTSYLFAVAETGGTLQFNDPGEEITGFREVSLAEIAGIADQLESLPPAWNDWGRFRALAHRLVVEVFSGDDGQTL